MNINVDRFLALTLLAQSLKRTELVERVRTVLRHGALRDAAAGGVDAEVDAAEIARDRKSVV